MRLKETTDQAVRANGTNARLKWLLLSASAIALAQVVPLSPAAAQTAHWNGSVSSDWFTAGNWTTQSPAGPPAVPTHNVQITTPGGVPTPTISTAQFANITGFVIVGALGTDGHLIVQAGGDLTQHTQNMSIGGANASVTVTDPGSTLIGRTGSEGISTLTVGSTNGAGTLAVLNGAVVNGYRIDVGINVGNVGNAIFSGDGTTVIVPTGGASPWLSVGFNGNGTVEISDGANVSSVIGAMATENGVAFVGIEGAGSIWQITGGSEFHVAGAGTATLNLIDGGTLDAGTSLVNIGRDDGGSGEVTIDGLGSLLTSTNDITIGNAGTGVLTVQSGGTVTTGGTLHIARSAGNGTLNIGAGSGDPAAAPGTVNAAAVQFGAGIGEINFNHTSTNYVFAPAISGPGVVNAIAGTTILTGDSTYTGGTEISSGATLQLGNGGTTGSITGDVANFGMLVFDRSNTYTFDGVISGNGTVTQAGTGTTVLTGTNTYSGGTFLDAGTLSVSADANLGATSGALTFNGGTLQNTAAFTSTRDAILNASGGTFQTDADLTWSGTISGAGALTKTGAATLILTADNSYAGGTTISAGTLQLGDGGTSGSIIGDVTNNGALTFNRSNTYTFSGVISGTGSVEQAGSGTTILTGDNTYTGDTTISAGTLQLGDGGTSGSIVGDIINNSALIFDRSDTFTVPGTIAGTGTVTQAGTGTTVLTGDNTYTGGTTISAGTLQLGSGGTTGSIVGDVTNNGTLAFDRSNTYSFDGVISGTGGVVQDGTGTTVFNTAQTYTGPTTINAGTLAVNGSIVSPTTINADGTLAGTGTIFNDVFNAGTLAPGPVAAGFGALTIDGGNYFGDGGTLRIRTALGGDSSPTSQLVINNGTATGSTGVRVVNQGGGGAATNIGIPIIVAEGSTIMESTAFSLSGPVVAGLYQYQLYQGTPSGGGTAQEEQSWYLRNTTEDGTPTTRPEGPLFGVFPGMARALNVTTIGTFHDRNGDQGLVRGGDGVSNRAWGRLFGQHMEQRHAGTLGERFKGNAGGIQTGLDLFNYMQPSGSQDRAGIFLGYAVAEGDAYGLALAAQNRFVGRPQLEATSVGAYWTHVGPGGGYLDAVLMGSFYNGSGRSTNDIGISVDGSSFTASLEGGYPIALGGGLTLEPQAQVIWQYLSLDGEDPFTAVDYDTPSAWVGRVGVRLAGDFAPWGWSVRPYLKANLVHDSMRGDTTTFAATDSIRTGEELTLAEFGAGFVAQFTPTVGFWGVVDYSTEIDGGRESREIWRANAGLRVVW